MASYPTHASTEPSTAMGTLTSRAVCVLVFAAGLCVVSNSTRAGAPKLKPRSPRRSAFVETSVPLMAAATEEATEG